MLVTIVKINQNGKTLIAKKVGKRPRTRKGTGLRDREATRRQILAAMGRILDLKGSEGLGINAIAREAKVDKVLIYRYFEKRLASFTARLRWKAIPSRNFEELAEGRIAELPNLSPAELAKTLILGFARAVRRRPITKEMMRWELQQRNELTEAMAKEREQRARQWLSLVPDLKGADLAAVVSVLAAGQVYLTLRSKTADHYNGIELNSADGWKRIEDAVALLCDLFFAHVAHNTKKTSAVKSNVAAKKVQS